MLKDLTIIIPCLDEVDLLRRCLVSIAERLPGQQVIVVKMGAWPTAALGNLELDLHIISSTRLCASAARNLGAGQATTNYLFFLDSDCELGGPPALWSGRLTAALSKSPDLVILRRAEQGRGFAGGQVTRWNFSRHCIEWNLIWSRPHFFRLGALDETCSPGSSTLAQAGEAFSIVFRHFEQGGRTLRLADLPVQHPSLANAGVSRERRFQYAYGSNYVALRPLRRHPSGLALFWFLRTLGGFAPDVLRGLRSGEPRQAIDLLSARALALWDALVHTTPRLRRSTR